MEWIDQIWMQIGDYINVPYLLIFMLLAYLVKRHFGELLKEITGTRWRTVYTVLIIATLTGLLFLLFTDTAWDKVLFSYAVGTSLHELVFEYIEKLFKDKT